MFCTDMTFDATVNPVVYEGGIPVFINTEADTRNMDPVALEKVVGNSETVEELDVTLDYVDYLLQAGKVSQEEYDRLQGMARECVEKL